jgi:hypothetical protein
VREHAYNVDKEDRMVIGANTVVNPHAVVIKPFDTSIADVTMSAFISANDSTSRAESIGVESLD